jgi:RNA polymerase sigma-70 factor (ECF subfamily)
VAISAINYTNPLADKGTHRPSVAEGRPGTADGLQVLIAACLRNDRSAQRRLYESYAATIYGMIRRYTEDDAIAQDIQSEAFCRIFSRLSQYRFEGAFEGWIRRITVHAVADYFRRHRPADMALDETTEDYPQTCSANALSGLTYKELLNMIQELPTTQRTVFSLFIFEQYPHKEIAAILGVTENNSRWHLNDARRRLKEKIAATNR